MKNSMPDFMGYRKSFAASGLYIRSDTDYTTIGCGDQSSFGRFQPSFLNNKPPPP
ncbi:MAG: hypothetical protein PF904_19445 [Kiritimatiellae bacterium]|nr:hypothetical protein [Kiritimatiellia bacterium]